MMRSKPLEKLRMLTNQEDCEKDVITITGINAVIAKDILRLRKWQQKKRGLKKKHDPNLMFSSLSEEFGELASAINANNDAFIIEEILDIMAFIWEYLTLYWINHGVIDIDSSPFQAKNGQHLISLVNKVLKPIARGVLVENQEYID